MFFAQVLLEHQGCLTPRTGSLDFLRTSGLVRMSKLIVYRGCRMIEQIKKERRLLEEALRLTLKRLIEKGKEQQALELIRLLDDILFDMRIREKKEG